MNRLFTLLLLSLSFVCSFSQQLIIGSVRDAFLKTPLLQTRITLLTTDSVVVQDSIKVNLNKNNGRWGSSDFIIKLPKETRTYLIRASLNGYEDDWQTLSVKAEIDDPWGLDSPLELKRIREKTMGEAIVTATKLKMFYKGDTLVYDATAFKMPEGSMLDDLIRLMPGVTMNDDGEIFVNGRKVDEMLLGSRSFLGGNSKVLLENLPYYTVKNLKVYEMESDRSRAVGHEIEDKKYVMDVNLKDEYRNGYIANIEAAGGTRDRWLGRMFLLGYTDKLRFTLLANANNVNEKRHIGESNSWKPEKMPRSLLTTKSVAGEVDYQSKDGYIKENFMFDFLRSKDYSETSQRKELFVDGIAPYSTYWMIGTSRSDRILAKNSFKLNVPQKVFTDFSIEVEYNKYKGNTEAMSEDYLNNISTRLRSTNYNDGHSFRLNVGGFLSPRADNFLSPFAVFYAVKHSTNKNGTSREFTTEQFVNPSTTSQFNTNDFFNRKTLGNIHLLYNCDFSKNLNLDIQDRNEYTSTYERDNLFHPDTVCLPSQLEAALAVADQGNSYTSHYKKYVNAPTLTLKWRKEIPGEHMKLEYISWKLNIPALVCTERISYTRNNSTQDKKRTICEFMPSFNFKILPTQKKGEKLEFQLTYEQGAASIFDLLDFKDDATPQIVKLGNPALKGPSSSTARISFTDWESKHRGQEYHINGQFRYFHRQVAQSVVFNPTNSQYVYQPQNVSGAYEATTQFGFTRFIDKRQQWSWQTTFDAAYNHAVDHVRQAGMKESAPNAVNTTSLHEGIWLQYQHKSFSARATGDFRWRHSESDLTSFTTINAFDYQYGALLRYTISATKTTLTVDGNVYCRHGYGSKAYDTNDFVINTSASQPFLKGKLIASIEAFDLLHKLSSTQYAINAQGRTVTWNRTLPNYVMLHVVYHFGKNPQKR